MMLKLSKVRSGRSADFLPPPPLCEKGRGGTGPQRSKFTSSGEGRLSGTFSRNRVFIVFRGCNKFTQKSRRRERVNLLKKVVAAGEQIYRNWVEFWWPTLRFYFQLCSKWFAVPQNAHHLSRLRVLPQNQTFQLITWNGIVCIPRCVIGCALDWGYRVFFFLFLALSAQSSQNAIARAGAQIGVWPGTLWMWCFCAIGIDDWPNLIWISSLFVVTISAVLSVAPEHFSHRVTDRPHLQLGLLAPCAMSNCIVVPDKIQNDTVWWKPRCEMGNATL